MRSHKIDIDNLHIGILLKRLLSKFSNYKFLFVFDLYLNRMFAHSRKYEAFIFIISTNVQTNTFFFFNLRYSRLDKIK